MEVTIEKHDEFIHVRLDGVLVADGSACPTGENPEQWGWWSGDVGRAAVRVYVPGRPEAREAILEAAFRQGTR